MGQVGQFGHGVSTLLTNGLLMIQYGISVFNSSADYAAYRSKFGEKQIGLIVLNSCNNDLTITRKILDLQKSGVTLENGEHLDLSDKVLGISVICKHHWTVISVINPSLA